MSVMPALSRALVPEVLPAVMPLLPAAPEFLPAAPAVPVLPSRVPADFPAQGRQALAAAVAGPVPGAQLPVNTRKENEIPVFRDLLNKILPGDLEGAVISADQMRTQRKHAEKIAATGAFFLFTIGDNQEKLFDAADALPWRFFAGGAWTAGRGRGRIDARTIKTLSPATQILKKWPQVRQVFLVERYSYGTGGELLGAVAILASPAFPSPGGRR
jgi:predicted transposase YbfD/YdcC